MDLTVGEVGFEPSEGGSGVTTAFYFVLTKAEAFLRPLFFFCLHCRGGLCTCQNAVLSCAIKVGNICG